MKSALMAVGVAIAIASVAVGAPQFERTGTQDNGNGTTTLSYTLSNYGGTYSIYDLDWSQIGYGWIDVQTPENWAYDYHYDGPMSRFSTNAGPCVIDESIAGFHITVGEPLYGGVMVYYTDIQHDPNKPGLATGTVQFPIPEPASMILLALGGLAVVRRRR